MLGGKKTCNKELVQESYTHVKTQFGGDLLRTYTRRMQINGHIEMSNLVSWIRTGQQRNPVCQTDIVVINGKSPNFKDSKLYFFCYNTKNIQY